MRLLVEPTEEPAVPGEGNRLDDSWGPSVPHVTGYRLIRRLGSGGMGEVWEAEQAPPLRRSVALKVIRRGIGGDDVIARFEAERQALALMEHPAIAHVFDAGATESNQPFFAMELVTGSPITKHCDAEQLSVSERLELFLQVCRGVHHAHQRGIIHRDLKPSNVLVTLQDDLPVPKIIDFGIAKATAVPLTEGSLHTLLGQAIGTPDFMSPEQAGVTRVEVDHRTDIYSLGILLYELLAGARPIDLEQIGELSFDQCMFKLWQEDPPTPSHRVSEMGDRAIAVAKRRRTSPEQLVKDLHDDLDWIVMKAIERNRADRYSSVGELEEDIQTVLRHESVPSAHRWSRQRLVSMVGSLGLPANSRRGPRRRAVTIALGLAVAAAVLGWFLIGDPTRLEGLPPVESLVVLPLENLTGDPAEQYFVDGVTTALITQLAKTRMFDVISRTSAMRYRSADRSVREIAEELDVDGVVEGAVLRGGNRIKIVAQLIDGRTDKSLWAEEYERDLEDTLRLQREVVADIVQAIREELSDPAMAVLSTSRRIDREVLETYLRGRALWNNRTEPDLRRAVEHFEQARRLDPSFAEAYAGLADAQFMLGFYGYSSGRASYRDAMANANKALALDATLAEAYATLGASRAFLEYDWEAAEQDLRRAIELNPSYESAHSFYSGFVLSPLGRSEEAIEKIKEAQRLDPHSPIISAASSFIHYWAGRDEQAVVEADRALESSPRFWLSMALLGTITLENGPNSASIALLEAAVESAHRSPLTLGFLGYAYGVSGRPDHARQIFAELEELAEKRYVSPYECALVQVGLGNRGEALDLLEKAVDERSAWVAHVLVDRRFTPLYGEPRFAALVEQMNLR